MNLAELARATEATKLAYWGKPLSFSGLTCAHLLHDHLVNTGHAPPAVPIFRTKKGAREALVTMGATSLPGLCHVLGLEEIAPAKMRIGDIAILPGEAGRIDGIRAAITICAGDKFMGWHGAAEGFQTMTDVLPHVVAAFRV